MSDRPPYDPRQNPNRARDHLANERTYLAWMRTAAALMGFGVVMVRMRYILSAADQARTHGSELGLLFALLGLLMVPCCTFHYFSVRRAIDTDTYAPAGPWVVLFSIAVTLVGAAAIYFLLTAPGAGAPRLP